MSMVQVIDNFITHLPREPLGQIGMISLRGMPFLTGFNKLRVTFCALAL